MYEVIKDKLVCEKDQYNRIFEKELESLLGKIYHIPRHLRHIVIQELLDLGFIDVENKGQKFCERIFRVN